MWGQGAFLDHRTPRRLFSAALIAFFALRALVPLGFMPDVAALGEGRFELVICTSSGEKLVQTVDLGGAPNGPVKSILDDCPFHTALGNAFAAPDTIPAAVIFTASAADFDPLSHALLPPALGPPLGSRAPPARLE
jgi:hypothetical protein